MTSELFTGDVWTQISRSARKCNSASFVAVAFVGKGATKMMPLSKGSRLVVDASKRTVKAGLTNPFELEKYYKKGVKIYSHKDLHAKVFVFADVAFVGSANVSTNSKNVLTEAILKSDVRSVLLSAKSFVKQIGLVEMGQDEILALQKVYVAPRKVKGKAARRKKTVGLRIVHLGESEDVPDDATEEVKAGEKRARLMLKARHKSEYVWYTYDVKKFPDGEHILFIQDDYMWPPSTVLFSQKVKGITVVHVEMSTQRDKSLRSVKGRLSKTTFRRLARQGVMSENASKEVLQLWDTV